MRTSPRRSITAAVIVGLLALTACGSDAKSSTTTPSDSSLAPEDIKVDDATVAAGLTQMPTTIAAAIAAIGAADAKVKLDAIEELWASFEGTVRDKDATLYLAIEDQLTPLQRQIGDGDAAAATATATTMSGLFTEYLEKHPA
jgi:ABC-type glycerol-3-phosphate transport system substrate-binding protein